MHQHRITIPREPDVDLHRIGTQLGSPRDSLEAVLRCVERTRAVRDDNCGHGESTALQLSATAFDDAGPSGFDLGGVEA